MSEKEYIITLKNKSDLEEFYTQMETSYGSDCIPSRVCNCTNRRPTSRNTHYMLTDEEVLTIKNDPRVLDVSLTPKELGLSVIPAFIQTESAWAKSSSNNSTYRNWGLLRCWEGTAFENWGSGVGEDAIRSGTVTVSAEGRNVDVVIVDGFFDPTHPEYAVNSDGSGGSRVVQLNWFDYNPGYADIPDTYVYTPYVDAGSANRTEDNNHGAHVAGTACGNSQGWARSANIYNINPYGTDVNSLDTTFLFDFIREWHNNKPINQTTGRRNPTICNNSWGYAYGNINISSITSLVFRGTVYNGPFTATQIRNFGIPVSIFNTVDIPTNYLPVDADIEDAINDGIIMVGAAGNDNMKIDLPDGTDYENRVTFFGITVFYHRGSSPGSALRVNPPTPAERTPTIISVGAIGSTYPEYKATYSNHGPRIDIWAPGTAIISSVNSTGSFGGTVDFRDSNYFVSNIQGTSMASPQVCGVLACLLEIYPNMDQNRARAYINYTSTKDQISDQNLGLIDPLSLNGAPNRFLYWYKERAESGNVFPKRNFLTRENSKVKYPRPQIRLKY